MRGGRTGRRGAPSPFKRDGTAAFTRRIWDTVVLDHHLLGWAVRNTWRIRLIHLENTNYSSMNKNNYCY